MAAALYIQKKNTAFVMHCEAQHMRKLIVHTYSSHITTSPPTPLSVETYVNGERERNPNMQTKTNKTLERTNDRFTFN